MKKRKKRTKFPKREGIPATLRLLNAGEGGTREQAEKIWNRSTEEGKEEIMVLDANMSS